MITRRVCVVMAFDTVMFYQAREAIELLANMSVPGWNITLVVLDLGLTQVEKAWLAGMRAMLTTDIGGIPNFADAPGYMRAMTCRPYMRDLLPGYDVYLWMDADIRLVAPNALQMYVQMADANRESVVMCQETDATYGFVRHPQVSRNYHEPKRNRMLSVYGEQIADLFDGFLCFNAGMFAMHRDALIWDYYRANLERAMKTPFDHMKEQDAMNVAIMQSGMKVCDLTPLYNWLCSASQPVFSQELQRWVRPIAPREVVSVLHLAASGSSLMVNGKMTKVYELYRRLGLTK
jgi:hypothetical protein